ncbi:MAG: hypothetical protein N2485_07090 [bacterium]|nr:hypothetical protein [bacterium]
MNNINKIDNIKTPRIDKKESPKKIEQTGISGENINIKADNIYIINNNFNNPIYNNYNNTYQTPNYPPYFYNFYNFYNLFNTHLYNYNPFILSYFYNTSLFNPYFYCNILPGYIYYSLFNFLSCF